MVDAAYHMIWEELKPGVRENDIVAKANEAALRARLRRRRGDQRHLRRALQSAPAQLHRPHHPAGRPGLLRHPAFLRRLPHLLLPHLQRRAGDAGPARRLQEVPRMARPRDRPDQAGRVDRHGRRGSGRRRRSSASPTRWRPSGCSSATASAWRCTSGRSSRGWCRSTSRWRSRPAWSSRWRPTARRATATPAARIEEEVVVTDTGCRVITLFPAEELPIANAY